MTNYKYSSEQTAHLRDTLLREHVLPVVERVFAKYADLRSAYFMVAQYWNDEADDAVHYSLVYSKMAEGDMAAAWRSADRGEPDSANLPDGVSRWDIEDDEAHWVDWDSNGDAIPAFAAFCKEGCHQEMSEEETHSVYAVFRRREASADIAVVGEVLRPWLDGVCPQWDEDAGQA